MFDLNVYLSSKGRIGRQTWWVSAIPLNIVIYILAFSVQALANNYENGLSLLLLILYALAAGANIAIDVKRLHDTDKSGWNILLGLIPYIGAFILLYFLGFQKGTSGVNRFGADPLAPTLGYTQQVTPTITQEDATEKLRKLKEMLDQGLISEPDYEASKDEILVKFKSLQVFSDRK